MAKFNLPLHGHIFSIGGNNNGGYDIPLHTRLGTEFLILLIALMTYLSLLSAAGSLALGHMANKWVSGLENAMTIEIPAKSTADEQAKILIKNLEEIKGVKKASILTQDDMSEILSPWLGNQTSILADLPLPVLITVELKERTDASTISIKNLARRVAPDATVDAHEDWLNDLMKLTNGLRFTALIIFGLILFVTSLVIGGAVRSRMAIHQRELELLHIMGATDSYISGQFIRYVLSQSLRGVAYGVLGGAITLLGFLILADKSEGTIPSITLQGTDWLAFIIVPLLLMIIGGFTARHTVLRVLNDMP
jgi:cell division transport system permease protein